MPYIKEGVRASIDLYAKTKNTGELNYKVSQLIDYYIDDHKLSYQTLNDVIGVLECLKMEVYRRIAVPYEDKKIDENGDVFTCDTDRTSHPDVGD
jgi:hypothetical protein